MVFGGHALGHPDCVGKSDIGPCAHESALEQEGRGSSLRIQRIVGVRSNRIPPRRGRISSLIYIMVLRAARTTVAAPFKRASFDARRERE